MSYPVYPDGAELDNTTPTPDGNLGWQNFMVMRPDGCREMHCVPDMDIAGHLLIAGACPCRPNEDGEQPDMWTHNAYDDRESYERGRKLN